VSTRDTRAATRAEQPATTGGGRERFAVYARLVKSPPIDDQMLAVEETSWRTAE